jgi:hypothetical protein
MVETYYDYNLSVSDELAEYTSTNQLSQDYWAHVKTKDEQEVLERKAREYFDTAKYNLEFEQFKLETKIDDLALIYPYVPRFYKRQGLFLIWSVDMDNSLDWLPESIAACVPDSLTYKNEMQMAKSSCPQYSEFFIVQLNIEQDYVFINTVKMPNWLNRSRITQARKYYKKFWRHLVSAFNKPVIVPSLKLLAHAHRTINDRGIPHEPYHTKMLQQAGLVKQPLGNYANDMIRISADEEVWICS